MLLQIQNVPNHSSLTALRGVWRLTSLDKEGLPFERKRQHRLISTSQSTASDPKTIWTGILPMKEFTTYPKKKLASSEDDDFMIPKKTEIFIKLMDDHTFEQCKSLLFSDGNECEEESLEAKLASEVSKREKESFAWKGTWDFIDGKLILAADRPEKKPFSLYDEDDTTFDITGLKRIDASSGTILVGRVSVISEESLSDNPVMEERQLLTDQNAASEDDAADNKPAQPVPKSGSIDVHLSVPKGKIKVGKFMYPKHHPSFFEQPIFNPQSMGYFELKQILGDFNAKLTGGNPDGDEEEQIELFRKRDLVGKRFYLSSYPMPKRKKKYSDGRPDKADLQLQKNMQVRSDA